MEVLFFFIAFILNAYLMVFLFVTVGTYYVKNKKRESMLKSVNELFKVIFYGIIFIAADFIVIMDFYNNSFSTNTIMNFLVLCISIVELSSNVTAYMFRKIDEKQNKEIM